jgi:type II secretory pathway predicted ATPase ExeA
MYETFFRLAHRPFAAAVSAERYVPTQSLEQARSTLVRVIDRAEGPGLVIGPAGTGKSLVCQLVARHFRGRFLVALLSSARLCTRRALLQNILFELKLPYRDMDESELRLSLVDHLEPRDGGNDGLLLVVDEAHTLPLRLWEEIRLITNLVRDGQPRVRLVMAGGMAIEERLANPKLESFQQRIAARCFLQAMNRDETIYYVQEQVRRALGGGERADSGQLFTEAALKAIHVASDGIPRLVNQLCDHALMLAALGGHRQLTADGIEEAWSDLQQLPVPWHEPARPAGAAAATSESSAAIEFGQLDEAGSNSATVVGPFVGATGEAAEQRLSAIESSLAALREEGQEFAEEPLPRDGEPDDFSPTLETASEVELIFHSAHDPFGGGWQEEEVVIDRYAMLEEARLRRVASEEGRKIAAALDRSTPSRQAAGAPEPAAAGDIALATLAPREAEFDPASDPLLPEEPAESTGDANVHRRATISLRELAGDDRDLIVVDDQARPSAPPAAASAASAPVTNPPAKRREYRQLFSSLRKR